MLPAVELEYLISNYLINSCVIGKLYNSYIQKVLCFIINNRLFSTSKVHLKAFIFVDE